MLSPRCFETGRRSLTQSSVEALVAETANGCLVLHRTGTIAERHKPRAEELEKTFHALLRSASGELFSLDKDLSWKSGKPYHESRGIFLMLHLAAPVFTGFASATMLIASLAPRSSS